MLLLLLLCCQRRSSRSLNPASFPVMVMDNGEDDAEGVVHSGADAEAEGGDVDDGEDAAADGEGEICWRCIRDASAFLFLRLNDPGRSLCVIVLARFFFVFSFVFSSPSLVSTRASSLATAEISEPCLEVSVRWRSLPPSTSICEFDDGEARVSSFLSLSGPSPSSACAGEEEGARKHGSVVDLTRIFLLFRNFITCMYVTFTQKRSERRPKNALENKGLSHKDINLLIRHVVHWMPSVYQLGAVNDGGQADR